MIKNIIVNDKAKEREIAAVVNIHEV